MSDIDVMASQEKVFQGGVAICVVGPKGIFHTRTLRACFRRAPESR